MEIRKEELDEMQRICESYVDNKESLARLDIRMDDCRKMKSKAKKKYDLDLIEAAERQICAHRNKVLEEILFFERALSIIGGRTGMVLRQLYVDRELWDNVGDCEGKRLSPSSIALERRKGFTKMAELYYAEAAGNTKAKWNVDAAENPDEA